MTKILVFSDSHRNFEFMPQAVKLVQPDMIFHLGDHISDADRLSRQYPRIPLVAVPGNCDYSSEPDTKLLTIEGLKIMLCHGHQYHVKESLLSLNYAAKEKQADAVLFGHTHRICCDYHNGLFVFNPGSIGAPYFKGNNSYGILEIDGSKIQADTKIISD